MIKKNSSCQVAQAKAKYSQKFNSIPKKKSAKHLVESLKFLKILQNPCALKNNVLIISRIQESQNLSRIHQKISGSTKSLFHFCGLSPLLCIKQENQAIKQWHFLWKTTRRYSLEFPVRVTFTLDAIFVGRAISPSPCIYFRCHLRGNSKIPILLMIL